MGVMGGHLTDLKNTANNMSVKCLIGVEVKCLILKFSKNMIKNLKDNKNCSQDEQPSRFCFVTKNYGLKDKASLYLNVMYFLLYTAYIPDQVYVSRMIVFLLFKISNNFK